MTGHDCVVSAGESCALPGLLARAPRWRSLNHNLSLHLDSPASNSSFSLMKAGTLLEQVLASMAVNLASRDCCAGALPLGPSQGGRPGRGPHRPRQVWLVGFPGAPPHLPQTFSNIYYFNQFSTHISFTLRAAFKCRAVLGLQRITDISPEFPTFHLAEFLVGYCVLLLHAVTNLRFQCSSSGYICFNLTRLHDNLIEATFGNIGIQFTIENLPSLPQ